MGHLCSCWWRGPYEITNVKLNDAINIYTIHNLVTQHEYIVDVTDLIPFYNDPKYVEYISERHR